MLASGRASDRVSIWVKPVSDTSRTRLKVSREGLALIKSFEGFHPRAVRGPEGGWVIGYGHTASAREGVTVDEQEAELLLQYDLLPVVRALNEQISAPLNQHQFDALASFAVSVGADRFLASDVMDHLRQGRPGAAADALLGWPAPPSPDAPLRRRAAERALFVTDPAAPAGLLELLTAPVPSAQAPRGPATSHDARAAAVAALLGESPPTLRGPKSGGDEGSTGDRAAPLFQPPAQPELNQRFAPYAVNVVGPLPGFPAGDENTAPADPDPAPATPADDGEASALSPFPTGDSLEETAPPAETADAPASETAEPGIFDETLPQPVLRPEAGSTTAPSSGRAATGAFLVMGLVGLGACAAAAAAFRKAMSDEAFLVDFSVIGGVLALIGLASVGVAAWNLYRGVERRD